MDRKIIHTVFEYQAEQVPEQIAVEDETGSINYHDLNCQANRLAHLLRHLGVSQDRVVGALLPPGRHHIQTLLAIFKAGGVYLPLHWDIPQTRWEQIFSKTSPCIVITSRNLLDNLHHHLGHLKNLSLHLVILENNGGLSVFQYANSQSQLLTMKEAWSENNPELLSSPEDSNYLFYTSGSTGIPKIIVGCHKSLGHFIHWESQEFAVNSLFRVSQLTQVTFDASLRDIFLPLSQGGCVCVPPLQSRDNLLKLIEWIKEKEITLIHCVPSLLRAIIRTLESLEMDHDVFPQLRYVLLAGEMLYTRDVQAWRQRVGNQVELVNLYGPTEATMVKTFHRIGEIPASPSERIHVGQPISHTKIIIANGKQLARPQEIGEVYIKTPFLSKGYFEDDTKTREYFLQNPVNSEGEDLVYRTGDLGRYLDYDKIEIIGRQDQQIKHNGIRVELGEIEQAILSDPKVAQAVVVSQTGSNGEEVLVGYFVEKQTVDVATLKQTLLQTLPQALVPAIFVTLSELPLTLNGKVNRKALPRPEELISATVEYVAPQTKLQQALAEIWADTLGLDRVGIHHSFFELGGHSLSATTTIARIYKSLGIDFSLKEFFENPTIRQLAACAEQKDERSYASIPVIPVQERYPVSLPQRQLWLASQASQDSEAYNMTGAYLIEGPFRVETFQVAFREVLQRHEILRTNFQEIDGQLWQIVHESVSSEVEWIDLSQEADPVKKAHQYVLAEEQRVLDLSKDVLLRMSLLQLDASSQENPRYVLLFNLHHIVGDDWSVDVLWQELLDVYSGHSLPPLSIQFKDVAHWQNLWLASAEAQMAQEYWSQRCANLPRLDLPLDFPRPAVKSNRGKQIEFMYGAEAIHALRGLALKQEVSLFMLCTTLIVSLLHRVTAQNDLCLGFPISGREHPDLVNQIGFFVNLLPLRVQLDRKETFQSLLRRVNQLCLEMFTHQRYPFERLVEEHDPVRDPSRSPLYDVGFTWFNRKTQEGEASTDFRISNFNQPQPYAKHDLWFYATESDEQLEWKLVYNHDLFEASTIVKFHQQLQRVIDQVVMDPTIRLLDLELEDEEVPHQEQPALSLELNF